MLADYGRVGQREMFVSEDVCDAQDQFVWNQGAILQETLEAFLQMRGVHPRLDSDQKQVYRKLVATILRCISNGSLRGNSARDWIWFKNVL